MPTATAAASRVLIPAGDHLLVLVEVEAKDFPDFNQPEVMKERWLWKFKSNTKDPNTGDRYEFVQFTGPQYGNPKAGLTLLVDQMFPKLSKDQKDNLDTDQHLGTTYKARIRHEAPTTANGDPKAKLVFIEPYTPKTKATTAAAPVAAPVVEEEETDELDPFADQ